MQTKNAPLQLPVASFLLALGVAIVWGFNYIAVKICLNAIPPLTLCALRFFFASIPAVFFVPKPNIPWRYLILYGLVMFCLQFAFLFIGIAAGVTAGIASILLQLQVFFALFFGYIFAKQQVTRWHLMGALVSFSGIAIIASHFGGNCNLVGFLLIIAGAMSSGFGQLISIRFKNASMLGIMVWSSLVAFFPLTLLAFCLEQPIAFLAQAQTLPWLVILSLAYITYLSTYFGYGAWAWLISRHPIASIAPFALLCPIIALASSTLFLHESFETWKFLAMFLVIGGLVINLFGPKIRFLLKEKWVSDATNSF